MLLPQTDLKLLLQFPTPCHVLDKKKLIQNLEILSSIQAASGCKILMAVKAYARVEGLSLIGQYLDGVTASSLHEAHLAHDVIGKEMHAYSPGFLDSEIGEMARISTHMVFNSLNQWLRFAPITKNINADISFGLRINTEKSVSPNRRYDPCKSGSRLGVTASLLTKEALSGIDGFHCHCSFEGNLSNLMTTVDAIEYNFGHYLADMSWLNLGGGQQITKNGYDRQGLITLLLRLQQQYHIQIYLEPGETVVTNAGYFVTTVVDIIDGNPRSVIIDSSAAAHLPNILDGSLSPTVYYHWENPARTPYIVGGISCLAADIFGVFELPTNLAIGDRIIFMDTASYSQTMTNNFNGIKNPANFTI